MHQAGFSTGAHMIDCAFHGFCTRDADPRISDSGKHWVLLRMGVGRSDSPQWLTVSCFGTLADKAAKLKKLDRAYIEGTLTLRAWKDNDGADRHGLSVNAYRIEAPRIGRNKRVGAVATKPSTPPAQTAAPAKPAFDDELP